MKNITLCLALAVTALAPFPTLAQHANQKCFQYTPDYWGDNVSSYINLHDGSYQKCIGNNFGQPENANPYRADVNRHLGRAISFRDNVNAELGFAAEQATRDFARSRSGISYSSSSAAMSGPIRLVITGQPNAAGVVQVRVEGFDLSVNGKVKMGSSSLFNASSTISGRNLSLVGTYNIHTGAVSLQNISEQLSVSVSFGGLVGSTLKTVFGNWARSKARSMERAIHEGMSGKFSEINSQLASRAFFSLDDAIPLGQFINPANGVDLGLRLRDQISHFISHNNLMVEMSGTSLDDSYIFIQSGDVRLTLGRRLYVREDDCPIGQICVVQPW